MTEVRGRRMEKSAEDEEKKYERGRERQRERERTSMMINGEKTLRS